MYRCVFVSRRHLQCRRWRGPEPGPCGAPRCRKDHWVCLCVEWMWWVWYSLANLKHSHQFFLLQNWAAKLWPCRGEGRGWIRLCFLPQGRLWLTVWKNVLPASLVRFIACFSGLAKHRSLFATFVASWWSFEEERLFENTVVAASLRFDAGRFMTVWQVASVLPVQQGSSGEFLCIPGIKNLHLLHYRKIELTWLLSWLAEITWFPIISLLGSLQVEPSLITLVITLIFPKDLQWN